MGLFFYKKINVLEKKEWKDKEGDEGRKNKRESIFNFVIDHCKMYTCSRMYSYNFNSTHLLFDISS